MKNLICGIIVALVTGISNQSQAGIGLGGFNPFDYEYINVCGELKTLKFKYTTDIGLLPHIPYALPWQIRTDGLQVPGYSPSIISDSYHNLQNLADRGLFVNVSARDTEGNELEVYQFEIVNSCDGL